MNPVIRNMTDHSIILDVNDFVVELRETRSCLVQGILASILDIIDTGLVN